MKGRISDSSLALLTIGSSRLAEASTDFVVVIKDAITKRDKWVSQNWPKTQTKKEISNWVGKNVETGEYVSSIAKEQRKMLPIYHWKWTRVHHDREYTRSVQKMLLVSVTLFLWIYTGVWICEILLYLLSVTVREPTWLNWQMLYVCNFKIISYMS